MHAPTLTHMADSVSDVVSTGKGLVQGAAHTVADRASDGSSLVGRATHSSVDTVADVVSEIPGQVSKWATKLATLTPFVEIAPARKKPRWLLRAVVIAALVGVGWWFAKRKTGPAMSSPAPAEAEAGTNERRLATATH